jgi:hypothetical protein
MNRAKGDSRGKDPRPALAAIEGVAKLVKL